MFLLNSRHGRFLRPARRRAPLLPKLRGWFAEFLNEVSLARLGALAPSHLCRFAVRAERGRRGCFSRRETPLARARRTSPSGPRPIGGAKEVSPGSCAMPAHRLGNVDPMSIGYAFRPGLRTRLTPGGRTWPGKPWDSGGKDFNLPFRYSCPHNRSRKVHGRLPFRFDPGGTLPYQSLDSAAPADGLTPDHFRRGIARPVSCYALFKWWLPLSQHPGCPCGPTSLVTEPSLGGLCRRSGLFPSRRRNLSPVVSLPG